MTIFLTYYFFMHQERKNGKNLKRIYGGFWCGIVNIFNRIVFHMMAKKN